MSFTSDSDCAESLSDITVDDHKCHDPPVNECIKLVAIILLGINLGIVDLPIRR